MKVAIWLLKLTIPILFAAFTITQGMRLPSSTGFLWVVANMLGLIPRSGWDEFIIALGFICKSWVFKSTKWEVDSNLKIIIMNIRIIT